MSNSMSPKIFRPCLPGAVFSSDPLARATCLIPRFLSPPPAAPSLPISGLPFLGDFFFCPRPALIRPHPKTPTVRSRDRMTPTVYHGTHMGYLIPFLCSFYRLSPPVLSGFFEIFPDRAPSPWSACFASLYVLLLSCSPVHLTQRTSPRTGISYAPCSYSHLVRALLKLDAPTHA